MALNHTSPNGLCDKRLLDGLVFCLENDMQQLTLFDAEKKSKTIIHVPLSSLSISEYNPRCTRGPEYVERLAQRIRDNGYEITRAMWVYQNESGYKVFAGGTRLEAARMAGVSQIPIVLHVGYSEDEIVQLANADNENDEYHEPVSILDVWASYQKLADLKWSQERIASVHGISQALVSYRLKLYLLPDSIKGFITQGFLTELHLREIMQLSLELYLSLWLTFGQAQIELAEWAASGRTTRETREKVKQWKEFIKRADQIYKELNETETLYDLSGDEPKQFEYRPCQAFIELLAKNEARSLTAVNRAKNQVTLYVANNLKEYKIWVDARTADEARKAIRAQKEESLLSKVKLGDYQTVLSELPDESVDLIFTDPPYDQDHIVDYGELAKIAARVLKPKGSLIVYAGHYALPQIFELMCPHLDYWWQLIVKHSGAAARQPGKWVFVHYKPLLWFTKGGRRDNRYVSDFIHSEPTKKEHHEWEQDVSEAKYCIEQLTDLGDLVVDPFCGSGTTAIAALELERNFIMGDVSRSSIDKTNERLIKWLDSQ